MAVQSVVYSAVHLEHLMVPDLAVLRAEVRAVRMAVLKELELANLRGHLKAVQTGLQKGNTMDHLMDDAMVDQTVHQKGHLMDYKTVEQMVELTDPRKAVWTVLLMERQRVVMTVRWKAEQMDQRKVDWRDFVKVPKMALQ